MNNLSGQLMILRSNRINLLIERATIIWLLFQSNLIKILSIKLLKRNGGICDKGRWNRHNRTKKV